MKKIEMRILGLSYSQSQIGSYVLVLSEINGNRKLPIIIKPSEAQVIALKVENVKSPRPLTHDLFKTLTDAFSIDIQEINIHTVAEGIFYTNILASNSIDMTAIECTAGDGIALSITYDCPIYVTESVLKSSAIVMDEDGIMSPQDNMPAPTRKSKIVSVEDLEKLMNEALGNEEYEIAAELRDKIKELKEKTN
jgi:bifunctional DNase/RNase